MPVQSIGKNPGEPADSATDSGEGVALDLSGLSSIPLHVVPHAVTLEGMLSAALDTLDIYMRKTCWHATMVGYDTSGELRFARDLGPLGCRVSAGVSMAQLRALAVDCWYLVSFGLFQFESGDVKIPHPTLSAAAVAVELGRDGNGHGNANYCIGQLGFIRPTGFVPTTLKLLSITSAGPQWGYTMLNELPI